MRPTTFRRSLLVLGLLASGCATTGRVAGVDGPVEWEVIDVGRVDSADGNRSRWSYTIVLKEKAGTAIQFERIERGAHAQTLETGGIARIDFDRRLDANGELRYHTTDAWGWVPGPGAQFGGVGVLGPLAMQRQFIGKDSRGHDVAVSVRVVLDRGFGRGSRQPPQSAPPAPPAKLLQSPDLKSLAGRWEGYYQVPGFQIPIEALIRDDGSVEFGEHDPVTNRFRGTLSVREGRVWYAARDTAEFTYHEGGGRHVLVGHLTPGTGGGAAARVPIWFERTSSAPATATAPPSPTRDPSLSAAVQRAFEAYKADPKYAHFKAFATDRRSDAWGRAWNLGSATAAMERALSECGKRGTACAVYAVGDIALESVSPEQRAVIVLGGLLLTYKGSLTMEQEGRTESSSATFYLRQGITDLTGSWQRPEPLMSGVFSGGVWDMGRTMVRMTQSDPCRADFTGVLSIDRGGAALAVSYTGPGCDGVPLKATFTGTRQ